MGKARFLHMLSSRLVFPYFTLPPVFTFLGIVTVLFLNCQVSLGSSSINQDASLPANRRVSRQYGGFGGFGTSLLASLQPQPPPQPYSNRRQQSTETDFFHSMMNLNFDMTEVFAMYRNVTAVAQTPGCSGHCRTPMALWVVQSFYPCYSLKKADCPRGLVCCTSDPSQRIASPNSIHDSRIKGSPSLASSIRDRDRGHGHIYPYPIPSDDSSALPSISASQSSPSKPTVSGPTESTTLFDEEYFKNNFIQDEIPE